VTISPISARAKDEPKAWFGISAGEIIGAIVSAPISRVVVVVIVVAGRRAIMPVGIISRPAIIVVTVIMLRPVVLIPPSVALMMISLVVGSVGGVGVMGTAASPSVPGSEQDHDGKNYKNLHEIGFHGRSPVVIESICSD
jgi:hypothetical protein